MEAAPEPSIRALGTAALVLAITVTAALFGATFAGDGSAVGGILPVGGGAVVALAAAFVAVGFGVLAAPRLGGSGLALVGSLALLSAWIGATIAWSITPDRSWDAFNRSVAFLAFLGLGIVLAGAAGRVATRVGAAVLALVTAAVLTWALVVKSIPSLDPGGDRVARLREPVEYWNALALLANIALALGLWLGASREHPRAVRIGGALLLYVATLALLLTLSRAGIVAGLAVVLLWLGLSRERVEGGLLLAASALPATCVAAWAFTRPALVEDGAARSDRVADGAVLGVLALVGAALVAVLVGLAVACPLGLAARRRAAQGLVLATAVGAAAVLAGVVFAVSETESPAPSCSEVVNDPSRLGSTDFSNRLCWWGEARDVYVEHAPGGAGAGTFEIARRRHRVDARNVSQPHNVPLQQLADGGIAGIALFLAFAAAAGVACVCALRRLDGRERAAAVALVAAPLAYFLHSLVDYSWDFLAVTAPTMVALGVLVGSGRPAGARRRRPFLAVAAVLVAGVIVASFAAPRLAERSVRESTRALADGDYERAGDLARRGKLLNRHSPEPIVALAQLAERQGFRRDAEKHYVEAVELQPENPETWYRLGLFEYRVLRNVCAAYEFLNQAWTLDPAGDQWLPGGPLDVAREAYENGECEAS